LRHCLGIGAMRIVAIHAGHRAFRHLVMRRLLKRSPNIGMACRAFFVDGHRSARHHSLWPVGMHRVAAYAGNLVAGVARFQPSYLRGLIQMAGHAHFVCRYGGQLGGIANVRGCKRLRVHQAGAVAGFASFVRPSPPLVGVHNMMWTFLEGVIDVLVAGPAGLRTRVGRRNNLLRRQTGAPQGAQPEDCQ